MLKFRVTDPQAVCRVFAVELLAANAEEARTAGLEAMIGCGIEEIDEKVAEEWLEVLKVTQLTN